MTNESPEVYMLLMPDKEILGGGSTLAAYTSRTVILQRTGISLERCAIRLSPYGLFLLHDGKVLMEQQ